MAELVLTDEVYDHVLAHARDGAPEEVCGVLGGTRGERAVASVAHRVTNVAAHPGSRYELDPGEQLRAMETIEDAGDEVVGFYHSHPRGPDRPSATDARQATWDGYSYVILSLTGDEGDGEPTLGSWRWREDEGFETEQVVVERRGGPQSDT